MLPKLIILFGHEFGTSITVVEELDVVVVVVVFFFNELLELIFLRNISRGDVVVLVLQ
jgi:hypothetical protein